MNLNRIYSDIIKDTNKNCLTEKYKFFTTDEMIYVVENDFICYYFGKEEFLLNIDMLVDVESANTRQIELFSGYKYNQQEYCFNNSSRISNKNIYHEFLCKDNIFESIWINQKFLKNFDENCRFFSSGTFNPLYIFEEIDNQYYIKGFVTPYNLKK